MDISEFDSRTNRQTARIDWIDIAKGYGILFVIFSHLGEIGSIGTWICTFHMPLFFFLSGYVFSTKYDFKTFVVRKVKAIIVPYFSLGFVMIIFQSAVNSYQDGFDIDYVLQLFAQLIIQRRFWTLWYIACLFFLNIIFYGLVKKFRTFARLFLVTAGMFCAGLLYYHFGGAALPWNIDVVLTSCIFFFGGYWFKCHYRQIRDFFDIKKSILLFGIMGIVNVCFGYLSIKISGKGMEMFISYYGFPPFSLISAFAGIACVVIVSHWFNLKGIKYIGKNSMLYYAWHQTIMIPIVQFVMCYVGIPRESISSYIVLIGERIFELMVIIILSTICNMCITKTRLRFMLGAK